MDRGVPLMLSGVSGLITDGMNYTFEDDGSSVPQVYANILWSTSEVSFDVSWIRIPARRFVSCAI